MWVIPGSIFIGGVHDFGSLVLSVKREDRSIADITATVISRRAKIFFASFVWLTLILVIAVFVYLCAKTLTFESKIVIPSLGLSGNWSKIWPIFGAANQLVAALALLVITMWLLSRNIRIIYTAIPCVFMLLTTIAALVYKLPAYFRSKDILLGIISAALLIFAIYMLWEVMVFISSKKK